MLIPCVRNKNAIKKYGGAHGGGGGGGRELVGFFQQL